MVCGAMTKTKNMTVTMTEPMEDDVVCTCPYCGARIEYVREFDKVIVLPPMDKGILPVGAKNQIAWLIFYSLTMFLLGAITYKHIIGPLL